MEIKEIKMNLSDYLKKIELGYFEHIKCVSVFKKEVYILSLNGLKEKSIINFK